MELEDLGYTAFFSSQFADAELEGCVPARVIEEHRRLWRVRDAVGERTAEVTGKLYHDAEGKGDLPAVGDWVALRARPGEERATIVRVLRRKSKFSRKVAGDVTGEQVVAANVDTVFVAFSLNRDLNLRRLERYLAMAWESGAQPVVLLTKTDLVDDVQAFLAKVDEVTLGSVPVHAVSARTGEGIDELRAWLQPNRTAVLLGSSGVGKSTIVNSLVGEELLPTQEVREDDQMGRHTTTHRELILVPTGGVVLDTPGIRELQLWDADLEQTFGDIEEIARRCRFSDCAHDQEPGCAIREALAEGVLSRERWLSYQKLQREMEAIEARRNHLLRQERVREYKIRARAQRPKKKR